MRIASYFADGTPTVGAVDADYTQVIDLAPVTGGDAMWLLEGGKGALEQAREQVERAPATSRRDLTDVMLLSPVPYPASIRDAMTFEAHIINCIRLRLGPLAGLDARLGRLVGDRRTLAGRLNASFYDVPPYYRSNHRSIVGTEADVCIPDGCRAFDYELEWGVFIGKEGVDIPEDRAHEHIAGYAIFNDFSARDIQFRVMKGRLGPAKGKDFDTGNAIGPWLVTRDEISDPYDLTMTARVDGVEWSRGNTGEASYSFEELIAHISRSETLYPGDFIGSGTCSGSQGRGCGLELGRLLRPGNVIELEVEQLGTLRNRVTG